jgi:ABC-type nitrate/sulfonate/bicarbonate transport system permease component
MATRGEVATAVAAGETRRPTSARLGLGRVAEGLVVAASIVAFLGLWQFVSRAGLISETDLPAMTTTFDKLWEFMNTRDFWTAFGQTVRGWALGLAVATGLAVPIGIFLGTNEFASRALRVPIEFLRPIPSAALIPLLFLTLGTTLKSEVFLAAFGAFWPLLIQTVYGVRDVDPLTIDTARSFGVGRLERLYRITLPSSVPYIATGLRISSTVALILAFTAELFMGVPGLGQKVNEASSYGLHEDLYAYAVATGFLGVAIHLVMTSLERRALRWHPSQRAAAP